MENIYFFLHKDDYQFVQTLTGLHGYDFRHPQLNWVWSTYYRLKQKGYSNVFLVDEIPDSGIIVMASNQRFYFRKFSKKALVVLAVADSPPWFYTQVNISQNPFQHTEYPNLFRLPVWKHIPHWPQPGIIPRSRERGDRFEQIAFFGDKSQLAPQLQTGEFVHRMQNLGLTFQIIEKDFNDYSGIDAVIAIRSFSKNKILNKPYSKLVNAWLAGVPIIVGAESSFQAVKKSDLDFISVASEAQLLEALKTLKENGGLRKKMTDNGRRRSEEFTEEVVLGQWEQLLFTDAQRYHQEWTTRSLVDRVLFYSDLFMSRAFRSLKKRIRKEKE